MKNIFADIPNKWKAVYLVWASIHLIIFLVRDKYNDRLFSFHDKFYPFDGFQTWYYDYSELLIYLFVPIVVYLVYWLWKKQDA